MEMSQELDCVYLNNLYTQIPHPIGKDNSNNDIDNCYYYY